MASTSTRFLDGVTLRDGVAMTLDAALDQGDHLTLEIVLHVDQAAEGDNPVLILRHAPVLDDDAWLDFPEPIRISLLRTGRVWCSVPRFTRYLGWSLGGTLSGEAVVTVDVIAKG